MISCRTSSRIELFTILKGLRALLVKSLLLREHVYYQINLVSHAIAAVLATLIVAEVAQRGYFVHVAFKLDHSWRGTIFDDELNGSQAL